MCLFRGQVSSACGHVCVRDNGGEVLVVLLGCGLYSHAYAVVCYLLCISLVSVCVCLRAHVCTHTELLEAEFTLKSLIEQCSSHIKESWRGVKQK